MWCGLDGGGLMGVWCGLGGGLSQGQGARVCGVALMVEV